MIPLPRSTMPLVPLIGQSRNPSPRRVTSWVRRSVSAGEIVLIWMTVTPVGAAPITGPRITSSTVASEGSSVHTQSAILATSPADPTTSPPKAPNIEFGAGAYAK